MTKSSLSASHSREIGVVSDWEYYFSTRDGAIADSSDLRRSASWRVTRPLRWASTSAARLRGSWQPSEMTALRRLESRMRAAAFLLDPSGSADDADELEELLERCCSAVAAARDDALVWLLFVAISGAMPDVDSHLALRRALFVASDIPASLRALRVCGPTAREHQSQLRHLDLRQSDVVVLTDFSARHGYNSGVQRVTREVSTRWAAGKPVVFAAFNNDPTALRQLSDPERARVLDWHSGRAKERSTHEDDPSETIIVPWGTTLVMPEVPQHDQCGVLSALARFSSNRVVALGYDTIPISSASAVSHHESLKFATYLSVIRHATRVVGISRTAAEEFRGYVDALTGQGLTGPEVTHLLLPVVTVQSDDRALAAERPVVLAVGSHEPRKNLLTIINAAEHLWREGLDFELMLLGGRGPTDYTLVDDAAAALTVAGRPLTLRNNVTEEELAAAYRAARFSVFISLHEGYGLPVAESLAVGTPVLTTSYGSVAEIAAGGGCLPVDPRDDEAVLASMRTLLTDDEAIRTLRDEIAARNDISWDEYAEDLWAQVVDAEGAA